MIAQYHINLFRNINTFLKCTRKHSAYIRNCREKLGPKFGYAYFRRRAEARPVEIISARLGSAWHLCVRRRKYSRVETNLLMISNQK